MDKDFPYRAFELVMIQPTSFCNIECEYCYLDINNRGQKNKMSFETLEKICERIFLSSLIKYSKEITFMWHEGEPLVMPISYYETGIEIINAYARKAPHTKPQHSILTNGTLINDRWCDFFKKYDVSVGVSVDGPEFIHDVYRKTRSGKGTFESVSNGISILKKNGINPYFLTTIHNETLKHPRELFEFYRSQNVRKVGFNFEEIIGYNKNSTLQDDNNLQLVKSFISEFYIYYKEYGKLFVREFDNTKFLICEEIDLNTATLDTIVPYSILTVNHKGDFSTFAPELIDMSDARHGSFIFGNVYQNTIEETIESTKFKSIFTEIKAGVDLCRVQCEYFGICGSNLPAHKITENGTFNSTETLFCRAAIKAVADKLIDELSEELTSL